MVVKIDPNLPSRSGEYPITVKHSLSALSARKNDGPFPRVRPVGAFRRALSDEVQRTILRESLIRYRRTRVGTKGGGKRTLKRYSKGSGVARGRAMRRFGSDRERRRRRANALYEFEMVLREEGISDFVYDEEKDLFRFPDGTFAFSREWADVDLLQERGYA